MFEMADYLKSMPTGVLIAIILLLSWVLHGYWNDRKRVKERNERALEANTRAIIQLQLQMEQLTNILIVVPKLKVDLDFAFEKIRDLEQRN